MGVTELVEDQELALDEQAESNGGKPWKKLGPAA